MGRFIYEGNVKTEVEDRALLHLQLVMTAKLRRGEPFGFSWREDYSIGGGRTTVWVHPGSNLVFKYDQDLGHAHVNAHWTEALAATANAPSGLYLLPEPAPGHPPRTQA
ncbi:ATP-dependent DNA ligase [Microbacterium sp. MYb66]|nr:ATP-dependent DNA ligase [Microbacterium sp. MYb66]PRA79292.1 ATP-dependent DNA ligase [Microbacterium sp. MYb66]